MFSQWLLYYFSRESPFKMVVVYDTVFEPHDSVEVNTYDIPYQVFAFLSNGVLSKMCVKSLDSSH